MPSTPKGTVAGGGATTAESKSPATASSSKTPARNGTTATVTSTAAGVQLALQSSEQLRQTFDQLNHELISYNDAHVVGRNPILLKSYFDQIVAHCMGIASALKVQWSPPSNARR